MNWQCVHHHFQRILRFIFWDETVKWNAGGNKNATISLWLFKWKTFFERYLLKIEHLWQVEKFESCEWHFEEPHKLNATKSYDALQHFSLLPLNGNNNYRGKKVAYAEWNDCLMWLFSNWMLFSCTMPHLRLHTPIRHLWNKQINANIKMSNN